MADFLQQLGNRFGALFGRVTVNSAANPSLWLCSVTVACFALAAFVRDAFLRWALFGVGLLPVINAIVTIQHFLWKNPAYLRSEELQLRQAIMERLGDDSYEVNMVEALLRKPPLVEAPPAIEHRPDEQ